MQIRARDRRGKRVYATGRTRRLLDEVTTSALEKESGEGGGEEKGRRRGGEERARQVFCR